MEKDTEIIIENLQFYNSQLEHLLGIFETVFTWFYDNSKTRSELSNDFTDRLYILSETHKCLTAKIKDNLNDLWKNKTF